MQAGNDSSGIVVATPTESSSIDITMTTPETATTPLSEQHYHQQQHQIDPRTAATRQKVVDIIDHQFDLEILLRHAEGASISQELAKAERMLEDLRHAILSGKMGVTSIFLGLVKDAHHNDQSFNMFIFTFLCEYE